MATRSSFLVLRRTVLAACLVLALAGLAAKARADDVPKFSDPVVTEYCTKYAAAADRYAAATKAKDNAKAGDAMSDIMDLNNKYLGNVMEKLPKAPTSEFNAYMTFMTTQNKKLD